MVIEDRLRTARKKHFCNICDRTIKPGEKYHYLYGCACSGDPLYHIKVCAKCSETAKAARETKDMVKEK